MTARNFNCPETEAPCIKTTCSRAHCADAVRRREAQANKLVRSQSLPAFRGTIAPGRWFTLRNGAVVMIAKKGRASWIDGDGERREVFHWVGIVADGSHYTWQLDGYVSPVENGRPHQMDIIGTAVRP